MLARVIGLFSGRGYNIDSLTVSETEHEKHLSRITVVTRGTPMVIEQIKNQLERLVPVHRVVDLTSAGPSLQRELAMVKVRGKGEQRMEALRLADAFRARVIDATNESFVFEITGASDKIESFVNLMLPLGSGRSLAHRRRRHRPRAGGDVGPLHVIRGARAKPGLEVCCLTAATSARPAIWFCTGRSNRLTHSLILFLRTKRSTCRNLGDRNSILISIGISGGVVSAVGPSKTIDSARIRHR